MATTQNTDSSSEIELPEEVQPFFETCLDVTGVDRRVAAAVATYVAARRLAPKIGGKRSQQTVADFFGVHQTAVSHHWKTVDERADCSEPPAAVDESFWNQLPNNGSFYPDPAFGGLRKELHFLVGEQPESKAFWEEICGTDDPREQLDVLEDKFGLTSRHEGDGGDYSVQIASQSPKAYQNIIDALTSEEE